MLQKLLAWFFRSSVLIIVLICGLAHAESSSVVQKKCLVEMKYGFVPRNCYLWAQTAQLNREKAQFFHTWFDSACQKVLEKNDEHVQYHVEHFKTLSASCKKQFVKAFQHWSYKARKETPDQLFKVLANPSSEIGKDLEYSAAHDVEKTKRDSVVRGFGRRLN